MNKPSTKYRFWRSNKYKSEFPEFDATCVIDGQVKTQYYTHCCRVVEYEEGQKSGIYVNPNTCDHGRYNDCEYLGIGIIAKLSTPNRSIDSKGLTHFCPSLKT